MALLNRLGRLFRADLHAVLDQLEEPALVLKEALRDMEAALAAEQARAAALARELTAEQHRARELSAQRAQCDAELTLCLDANNDALARSVVRRQLLNAERLAANERRRQTLAEKQAELEGSVGTAQRQLDELRQRAALLDSGAEAGEPAHRESTATVTEEAIDIALLRAKQQRGVPCV